MRTKQLLKTAALALAFCAPFDLDMGRTSRHGLYQVDSWMAVIPLVLKI